jgi:three-Cys-motif partner protein
LKHALIRQYIQPFASKVGSFAPQGEVGFFDGYAGPGSYGDGRLGSPALAAETAKRISEFRKLRCFYIEKDSDLFHKLIGTLQSVPHDATFYLGDVEEHLDSVLAACHGIPLLAFLDPFGLGIPFQMLEGKLLSRSIRLGSYRQGPPTEVLLNFSLSGLRRNAGHLLSENHNGSYQKARQTILDRVDLTLGGCWWREVWESADPNREEIIVAEYCNRLRQVSSGWSTASIPIRSRVGGPAIYYLLFLTQHREGLWQMSEALSLATEEWREYLSEGQITLPIQDGEWIAEIADNVGRILKQGKQFKVIDRMLDVYGTTIGMARSKHVRAAIKLLHRKGITPSTGVGTRVDRLIVTPAS